MFIKIILLVPEKQGNRRIDHTSGHFHAFHRQQPC